MFIIRNILRYIYAIIFLFFTKIRPSNKDGVRLVIYHSLKKKYLDKFEQQIQYLANNYNVISMNLFIDSLKKGKVSPKNAIVITFDDGYKDNFFLAAPVLKKYNLPAVFFITPQFVENDRDTIKRIAEPDMPAENVAPSMTWEEISSLVNQGFEIGSHGLSHRNLAQCDLNMLFEEINQSKKILEDKLKTSIKHFSFPFGAVEHSHPQMEATVQRVGYLSCSSGVRGKNNSRTKQFFIYRDHICPSWPIFVLDAIMQGAFDK